MPLGVVYREAGNAECARFVSELADPCASQRTLSPVRLLSPPKGTSHLAFDRCASLADLLWYRLDATTLSS